MKKILITGATDGIGRLTARMLVVQGHRVLLHGRNRKKLDIVEREVTALSKQGVIETYQADLSHMREVEALGAEVKQRHEKLDVLINNAGVFRSTNTVTADGLDVRFAVNTVAPYLLVRQLLPLLGGEGRVVNLSSAAQAPVDPRALTGQVRLSDGAAYAQSKLALTMWSRAMALTHGEGGPVFIAVNPGSMLGTKMVRQAYGVSGGDVRLGAEILCRAALDDAFATASGAYFDNDQRRFASPHPDALNNRKIEALVASIEAVLDEPSAPLHAPQQGGNHHARTSNS